MIFAGMYGSRKVASLNWLQRWLYSALLHMCDDFGLFEADAALIRAQAVPHDTRKVSDRDVESGLSAIEQADLVKFYTLSGKRYGVLWNFRQKRGYKPHQLYPPPPPNLVEWQKTGESSWEPPDDHPRKTKPNQTKANQGKSNQSLGVHPALLCGYALEACRVRLTLKEAGDILQNVNPQHDWAVVAALEVIAARDERTRWNRVKSPPAMITAMAQEIRDGIGPQPEGEYEPFENWKARQEAAHG